MQMKVAVIIERAQIALGGAERSVFELTNTLSAAGVDVDLLAAAGETVVPNIHVLCTPHPTRRVRLAKFGRALNKYLASNHYDIIHSALPFGFADVYQPRGGTYAESIIRNAESYGPGPRAAFKKAIAFTNVRRTALLQAEKALCTGAEGPVIAALSNYVKNQFKNHYSVSDGRVLVIANGIKTTRVIDASHAAKLRSQILGQVGLEESANPALFLFVANNFRLKGLTPLIRAMQLVKAAGTDRPAYLIVAGRDKPHAYRRLARKLGVADRIVFLGRIRHTQNAFAIADVAVLPTYFDPCSRFILEALAAVKPVITTRFNGAVDLFTDNRHGRVIDAPENITALAEAIIHFCSSENTAAAARAIVQDNLRRDISISRHADQLIQLYQTVLKGKRK